MKLRTLLLIFGLFLTLFPPQSQAEPWDRSNAPSRLSSRYVTRLDELPLSGSLSRDKIPWSDTFWPSNFGSIAMRWNTEFPRYFDFTPFTREALLSMNPDERFLALARLSPAEKFDLFQGNYDYPTLRRVRRQTSPRDASWEGICHGWAPASLLHAEPAPVVRTNPDGLEIPFGSSDIKALLSYYYAFESRSSVRQLGLRCQKWGGNCGDVNAGAFHIVLTNQIGLMGEGFLADVDRLRPVWNQPVYAFESRWVETSSRVPSDAAAGTTLRVLVETRMVYGDVILASWEPVKGTQKSRATYRDYRYWLELDAKGRILGGQWLTEDRPDFLWTKAVDHFRGTFAGVGELYEPASAPNPYQEQSPLPAAPLPGILSEDVAYNRFWPTALN